MRGLAAETGAANAAEMRLLMGGIMTVLLSETLRMGLLVPNAVYMEPPFLTRDSNPRKCAESRSDAHYRRVCNLVAAEGSCGVVPGRIGSPTSCHHLLGFSARRWRVVCRSAVHWVGQRGASRSVHEPRHA